MDMEHINWNSPEGKLAIEISELWDRMGHSELDKRRLVELANGMECEDTKRRLGEIDSEVRRIAGHLSPEKLSEVIQLAIVW